VRVAWIPHEGPATIETIKKAAEDFNKAGKFLKENHNLTFCYHNHGYEFVPYENGTLFDYLAANTNPDFVSFELDVVWAHLPGYDPAELIKKYPTRLDLCTSKMFVKVLRATQLAKSTLIVTWRWNRTGQYRIHNKSG
jgi:sugar phosphate isomerase/epimerase